MDALIEIGKQAPALFILTFLIIRFGRFVESIDERHSRDFDKLSKSIEELTKLIKEGKSK